MQLVHNFGSTSLTQDLAQKSDEEFVSYVIQVVQSPLIDENGYALTILRPTEFHGSADSNSDKPYSKSYRNGKERRFKTIPKPEAVTVTK